MSYFSRMNQTHTVFSRKLIHWYLEHKRNLPWRKTKDPYFIWLSEVILQQTRVAQGLPYYLKFVEKYPDVHHLANASEDEILKTWQGLGYYSRARNLHAAAKYVSKERNGVFPNTHRDLIRLKGVGDYTASAIGSICFNIPEAVVDGNVFRVLSRIFGISTPINIGAGQKEFKSLAQRLIDEKQPGVFNQALMEFGSLQCVPKNPDCAVCIFKNECVAFQTGKIEELPVKIKSKPVRKRYFNYLIPISPKKSTLLQQRKKNDIWEKLFEFPLLESEKRMTKTQLLKNSDFLKFHQLWEVQSVSLFNPKSVIHKLSHQHIDTRFWILNIQESPEEFIAFENVKDFAVPVLIENFINEFFKN